MVYPRLLRDVPTAPLCVHPKATVIAEKLHTVAQLPRRAAIHHAANGLTAVR
jgi:hypothetical protein